MKRVDARSSTDIEQLEKVGHLSTNHSGSGAVKRGRMKSDMQALKAAMKGPA